MSNTIHLDNCKRNYSVAILGATGMVGQRFVQLLENHPWFKIKILAASKNSAGKTYEEAINERWSMNNDIPKEIANAKVFDVVNDCEFIASNVDFAFCAVNMEKSKIAEIEEKYAKFECPIISNNSAHRWTPDVPMIIPEINRCHSKIITSQRKRLGTNRGFIAVKSNCSLQCFVPAIYPLLDLNLENVIVSTYQAISGAGKTFQTWPEMVDNLIPYIPGEEAKTQLEPLKIFGQIDGNTIKNSEFPKISAQCYRIPVSDGHTAAVFVKFKNKIEQNEILERWKNFVPATQELNLPSSPKKFLNYFDDEDKPQIKYERNLENGMAISIGRLQKDEVFDYKFVCMSHNTVRGAAGGAVLMAEQLCAEGYI